MLTGSVHSPARLHQHSLIYYLATTVTVTSVVTLLTVVVPVLIVWWLRTCEGTHCLSLGRDLQRSVDTKRDPCHNFYDYVCSRWGEVGGLEFVSPRSKYNDYISDSLLKNFILKDLKRKHNRQNARSKAILLLARCAQYRLQEAELTLYLRSLKLRWPARSPATRLQVLDIMVGSSLDYGIPAVWSFIVGRHPKMSRQNTLYLAMDYQVRKWISHLDRLQRAGNVAQYLRACAEIVGGRGLSYDRMITDVLSVHQLMRANVDAHYGIYEPAYINFSDVDLRLAVNRHLPDSSQMWPEDEVLCMEKSLFEQFSDTCMNSPRNLALFKLYLGAYLVWYLSPLTSTYLTDFLMRGMNAGGDTARYTLGRCFDTLARLMPMVVWKSNQETIPQADRADIFRLFRSLRENIDHRIRSVSPEAADDVEVLLISLGVAANNFSISWDMIEKSYEFIPHLKGSFFHMYLTAARANARTFRASMRKPATDIVYMPIVSNVPLYRLLVCREIRTPRPLLFSPVYYASAPAEVKMATLGSQMVYSMAHLLYFVYFRDDRFQPFSTDWLSTDLIPENLMEKIRTTHLTITARLNRTSLRDGEKFELLFRAVSMNVAYTALLANRTTIEEAPNVVDFTFPLSQLFYLVSCFLRCRSKGASRKDLAICNVVVPQVPGFEDAFGCEPGRTMELQTLQQEL